MASALKQRQARLPPEVNRHVMKARAGLPGAAARLGNACLGTGVGLGSMPGVGGGLGVAGLADLRVLPGGRRAGPEPESGC